MIAKRSLPVAGKTSQQEVRNDFMGVPLDLIDRMEIV